MVYFCLPLYVLFVLILGVVACILSNSLVFSFSFIG